tara:strand:+ start:2229 stop:2510 length:282 start_codon:yes stop_codon:yes gene_type:complete
VVPEGDLAHAVSAFAEVFGAHRLTPHVTGVTCGQFVRNAFPTKSSPNHPHACVWFTARGSVAFTKQNGPPEVREGFMNTESGEDRHLACPSSE